MLVCIRLYYKKLSFLFDSYSNMPIMALLSFYFVLKEGVMIKLEGMIQLYSFLGLGLIVLMVAI